MCRSWPSRSLTAALSFNIFIDIAEMMVLYTLDNENDYGMFF